MAGRAAVARFLCAFALFALAFMISPHRVGALSEAVITSDGPLTQSYRTEVRISNLGPIPAPPGQAAA